MASSRQLHAQIRQSDNPDVFRSGLQRRQLVKKTVIVGREKASVLVPDGIKAEELTIRAVVVNGGAVGMLYNEQYRKHEIVAIKIGSEFLVKEKLDFDKISWEGRIDEGDLEKANELSRKSRGGLHFFIGENGIPLVVKEEKLIFPSGDEMGTHGISEIRYRVVDSNENPETAEEFRSLPIYGNSQKRRLEGGHATGRERDIEVRGDEIQVGDTETGEIMSVSEMSKVESFRYDKITVDDILRSEIKQATHHHTAFSFENRLYNIERECGFYYLHIEIINAKDNIFNHVGFIPDSGKTIAAPVPAVYESAGCGMANSRVADINYCVCEINDEKQSSYGPRGCMTPEAPAEPDFCRTDGAYGQKAVETKKVKLRKAGKKKEWMFPLYSPKTERPQFTGQPLKMKNLNCPFSMPVFNRTGLMVEEFKTQKLRCAKRTERHPERKRPKPRKRKERKIKIKELVRKTISEIRKTKIRIQKLLKQKAEKKKIKEKTYVSEIKPRSGGVKKKTKKEIPVIPKKTRKKTGRKTDGNKIKAGKKKAAAEKKRAKTGKKRRDERKRLLEKRKKIIRYLLRSCF